MEYGSGSNPPPKQVVIFDVNGSILHNKSELMRATRDLIISQLSVGVGSWHDVTEAQRDDLWNIILRSFDIDEMHRGSVMTMMGNQLRQFRTKIRKLYVGDRDRAGILALLDHPQYDIPLAAWNHFILREAEESKLNERAQNSANRALNEDLHCLGRKSYAEKSAELTAKGIEHDRAYLYRAARTKKDGNVLPGAAAALRQLRELEQNQNDGDRDSITTDALSRMKGPDHKGRVRAVGSRIGKWKLLGINTMKNFLSKNNTDSQRQSDCTRREYEERFNDLSCRLDRVEGGRHSVSGSIPIRTPPATPATPTTPEPCMYEIRSINKFDVIALGNGVIHENETEARINVMYVLPGREDEPLYNEHQDGVTTMGGMRGRFLIWPTFLLRVAGRALN